jgi:hypothetical protein
MFGNEENRSVCFPACMSPRSMHLAVFTYVRTYRAQVQSRTSTSTSPQLDQGGELHASGEQRNDGHNGAERRSRRRVLESPRMNITAFLFSPAEISAFLGWARFWLSDACHLYS